MTVAVVFATALAILVWVLKNGVILSVRADHSGFDPEFDKHIRDILDD